MARERSLPETAISPGWRDWQDIGLSGYAASILLIVAIILFGLFTRVAEPIVGFFVNRIFHGPVFEANDN